MNVTDTPGNRRFARHMEAMKKLNSVAEVGQYLAGIRREEGRFLHGWLREEIWKWMKATGKADPAPSAGKKETCNTSNTNIRRR